MIQGAALGQGAADPLGSDPGSSQGDINVGASGHVNRRVGRPSATRCSLLELGLAFSGHEPAF
ncbi:hypothetical protein BD311DRAFT_782376 [Dichomitus squalens]|uniref:Uncharacterized protein n=1 Tax=Dichomitus squalens TaxID=114155 RepID=A0A4Q9M8W9_9APHY|nr:hypothetical protein BD311DRAFT_782376 [Dichomitus squalens]